MHEQKKLSDLRFGVIGAGSMANRRIRHIRELTSGEVLCYDLRADRRHEVAEKFGIETVDDLDVLISKNPDVIFICVPPADHKFYIDLALENHWHFMSEQPISHSLDGIDGLIKSVESVGLVTHISNNMSYNASVEKMKELIENRAIGPVLTGIVEVGEWLPDWHSYEPYTDYYPSSKERGGGLDAVCDISWVCKIFGSVARMACFAGKKTTLNIDTDDLIQILLDFENGPQIFLHADMIQRPYVHKAKFIGEGGCIEWDYSQSQVRLFKESNQKWQIFKEKVDTSKYPTMKGKERWEWVEYMYLEDARAFIDRLSTGDTSTQSLREGIDYVKLAIQALGCNVQNKIWISD